MALLPIAATAQELPSDLTQADTLASEFSTPPPSIWERTVVVGNDTLPLVMKERNFGRYHRGLYNFLFIPQGQWMAGLTASYGEVSTEDMTILKVLQDFKFKGTMLAIKPSVSYFFRSNQSVGMRFTYTRGLADIGSLAMDLGDDLSFDIHDVSFSSNTYSSAAFYRSYVGLGTMARFAVFNEVGLEFGGGSNRFKRTYDGELFDTHTKIFESALTFSPGVCVFIMDNVSFNVSFGVFGLKLRSEHQTTNGEDEGSRFSSGANFKFNLFNINFGIGVHI